MKILKTPAIAFLAVLAGCATPYQRIGFMGGVSATQIDATTLRVSSLGNAFTRPETIQNYVLLKAAEETQRLGYDLFLVVNQQDTSETGYVSREGYHEGCATGSINISNSDGQTSNIRICAPTQPSSGMPIKKPGSTMIVKLFKGAKPADASDKLFVASEVIQYLGPHAQAKR